jgi:hypothetical protein
MQPLYRTAVALAFELAAYGAVNRLILYMLFAQKQIG